MSEAGQAALLRLRNGEILRREGARGNGPELTRDLMEAICELIEAGNFIQTAAAACGVARSTLHHWRDPEVRPEPLYEEFRKRVDSAQAAAESRFAVLVTSVDPKFYLTHGPGRQRKGKEGWGQVERVELTGKDGKALDGGTTKKATLDVSRLTPEQRKQLRALINAALPDRSEPEQP